jgi:sulfate permease, SulP family
VPRFVDVLRAPGIAVLLPTIVGGALALAIIGSIDALLCAKLLARPGEPKLNGDHLLMRLGTANSLAACWAGITGGLNIGPSQANRSFGGRTPLSSLVNAVVLLVTLIVLFPLLSYLPCVALSAVIMVVAVQHVDPWTVSQVRRLASSPGAQRRKILVDLLVVLLVAVLSVAVDIVLAVFLGVAIAALLFMARMSRSVIRRAYRCTAVRSRKLRPAQEFDLLARSGGAALVMELQGALFFGSAEKLAGEIAAQSAAQDTRYVILDLRRITEIDSTGLQILKEIHVELAAQNKLLLLCLAEAGVTDAVAKERIFPDLDRAIQWAEDDLLRAELRGGEAHAEIPLAQAAILAGFSESELATVQKHLKRVVYQPGKVVFREGDAGKELFITVKGAASAFLKQASGADIRLVTFATGTVFGELAILDAGKRSATVVAEGELVCYLLAEKDFASLSAREPEVAIKLLANLGRQLSHRLRAANRTIEQLEE